MHYAHLGRVPALNNYSVLLHGGSALRPLRTGARLISFPEMRPAKALRRRATFGASAPNGADFVTERTTQIATYVNERIRPTRADQYFSYARS